MQLFPSLLLLLSWHEGAHLISPTFAAIQVPPLLT